MNFSQPGSCRDPLENLLQSYLERYLSVNRGAHALAAGLRVVGIGLKPVVDHLGFRSLDAEKRAGEFTALGYERDAAGWVESETGRALIFRKAGYPALCIEQPCEGAKSSRVAGWVHAFGDQELHYAAIHVEDVESGVFYLEKQGVAFSGRIEGDRGDDLRFAFTQPEKKDSKPHTLLCLVERHHHDTSIVLPRAGFPEESGRSRHSS